MACIAVTGINGFVGKHLLAELVAQGHEVIGVGREENPDDSIKKLMSEYFACDITDPNVVKQLPLEKLSAIINLAGMTHVGASFKNPEQYLRINVDVLKVVGDVLLENGYSPRVIAVSTGTAYASNQQMPLTEESELTHSGSPYAMSKILMEEAARELKARGLDCVIVRPFNHIGPGQEPGFLVPDLYGKIVASQETGSPVTVGDLNTRRDYTDVRDVVRAYVALATTESLNYNLYNVCSGRSVSGKDVLEALVAAIKPEKKFELKVDPSFIRPNDPSDLYGSNQRLLKDTGWQPQIPFEQTISDFITSKQ